MWANDIKQELDLRSTDWTFVFKGIQFSIEFECVTLNFSKDYLPQLTLIENEICFLIKRLHISWQIFPLLSFLLYDLRSACQFSSCHVLRAVSCSEVFYRTRMPTFYILHNNFIPRSYPNLALPLIYKRESKVLQCLHNMRHSLAASTRFCRGYCYIKLMIARKEQNTELQIKR